MDDDSAIPDTVARSNFQATRLLSLQTRNSAAYKGIMALILQDEPHDFATAEKMSIATYTNDRIEQATGKSVAGRDSQETIEAFGKSLENPQTSPTDDTDENY